MDQPEQPSIARKHLRALLLERREGIVATERRRLDERLAMQLAALPLLQAATTIAVYAPIRSEPDLGAFYAHCRAGGKTLALPVVTGKGQPLVFARYDADTELVEQRFGVNVPRFVEPLLPDLVLMPCVGFSVAQGGLWRLGYGAGFYDRTLAARPVPAVGIAYDEAETADYVPEPYDMPLSAIVTPSRCITSIASP